MIRGRQFFPSLLRILVVTVAAAIFIAGAESQDGPPRAIGPALLREIVEGQAALEQGRDARSFVADFSVERSQGDTPLELVTHGRLYVSGRSVRFERFGKDVGREDWDDPKRALDVSIHTDATDLEYIPTSPTQANLRRYEDRSRNPALDSLRTILDLLEADTTITTYTGITVSDLLQVEGMTASRQGSEVVLVGAKADDSGRPHQLRIVLASDEHYALAELSDEFVQNDYRTRGVRRIGERQRLGESGAVPTRLESRAQWWPEGRPADIEHDVREVYSLRRLEAKPIDPALFKQESLAALGRSYNVVDVRADGSMVRSGDVVVPSTPGAPSPSGPPGGPNPWNRWYLLLANGLVATAVAVGLLYYLRHRK